MLSLARTLRSLVSTSGALACATVLMSAPAVQAGDKVVAGSLGGQAPLWAIYVAVHKGFFAAEGIDLELNFAQSGSAVIQQLTAGSLDVALSVGITSPIHAIDKGADLALIRVVGNVAPYVLIGKPALKSIANLKGKTVSVGATNDITTTYFERMAAAHGLKRGDYDLLSQGVAAARYASLKAGVADAALVLPPLNFQAEKAGFAVLGLAADYAKDLPFTGMAVSRRFASAHAAVVKRILAATDKSIAWFVDPAHRGEAIDLLVSKARATPENAQASYEFLRRIAYFERASPVSRKKLQNLIEVERRIGNVGAALTVDKLTMPGITELID